VFRLSYETVANTETANFRHNFVTHSYHVKKDDNVNLFCFLFCDALSYQLPLTIFIVYFLFTDLAWFSSREILTSRNFTLTNGIYTERCSLSLKQNM